MGPTPLSGETPLLILGIETSCDDTGLALYHSTRGVLAQNLSSHPEHHAIYGGIVPELASRDHIRHIMPLLRNLFQKANCSLAQVHCVAYTRGPGLAGTLLVGAAVASGLAWALRCPCYGLHHLEAHLLLPFLYTNQLECPFVALLVSGGHTELLRVPAIGQYEILGATRDDAAGEAFDKIAQLLTLGCPGGPAIAAKAREGRALPVPFPRPLLPGFDFSFSGLKTAVRVRIEQQTLRTADVAYEAQEAITDVLVYKATQALQKTGYHTLVVAGGVSANERLRQKLAQLCEPKQHRVYYAPTPLCTDNGVMVAFATALKLSSGNGLLTDRGDIRPHWPLTDLHH